MRRRSFWARSTSGESFVDGSGRRLAELTSVKCSVEKIAKDHGVSMAQVALAWLLSKPYITAPVVGTTSILHDLRSARLCCGRGRTTAIHEVPSPGRRDHGGLTANFHCGKSGSITSHDDPSDNFAVYIEARDNL